MRNNERIKSIGVLCLFLLGKMFFFVLNSRWKRSALWLIIGFSLLAVFNLYNGTSTKQIPAVNYSEFVIQVKNGQVADAFIRAFSGWPYLYNLSSCKISLDYSKPCQKSCKNKNWMSWFPMHLLVGFSVYWCFLSAPNAKWHWSCHGSRKIPCPSSG